MIAPAEKTSPPWTQSTGAVVSAPKTAFLKDSVCCIDGGLMACRPPIPSGSVMQALRQLVEIVMQLRSPMGGWPADLEQTPESLATYVGEEIWGLLDVLDQEEIDPAVVSPAHGPVMVSVTALIPHLLWLLASSNYEVMRLLEGVSARIYATDTQFCLGILRLVPVLSLRWGDTSYSLDLVTQAEPDAALLMSDHLTVKLVENDLDDQPMGVTQMLDHLRQEIAQTKPQLSQLLSDGWQTRALSPYQTWQDGTLQLRLYLANMGGSRSCAEIQPAHSHREDNSPSAPFEEQTSSATNGFTLDDFAEVLEDDRKTGTPEIFGDWLTFTDEPWVQKFLRSCACEIMLQHLPELMTSVDRSAEVRELACMELVYAATNPIQADQALSNHTFVHEPALVADVWLRLRWYLAHCSERVMQLMGGVSCRVLIPDRGWQQGYLYLRPVMTLTGKEDGTSPGRDQQLWILDLGNGRLLATQPPNLPADAVAVAVNDRAWPAPITIGDLTTAVGQDFAHYAPAIAALEQTGTRVNLHRLEAEEGLQSGTLTLNWGFTLEPTL